MTDPDATRLLADEEAEWPKLEAAFARIPSDRFEEAGVTPEGWSPKDTMFHIARWAAEAADVLDLIAKGRPVPADHEDTDTKNRVWFEESRGMDPDAVREAFASDRSRMRSAFEALPHASADARSWFEESGSIHYRSHLSDLDAWTSGSDT